MKVSVLIPVFNKSAFVKDAIDTVLADRFQDLEIVAVDDRSTDASLDVLHAIRDPRLRVIALPENRGPAGAANAGLDTCTGEYIVRLDADDLNAPDRIARQVAFMDAHAEVGASGGQVKLFGADGSPWHFPITNEACQAQLPYGVPVSQGASILRRSVLERHHLRYDPAWPRVGEDWCFWARMAPFTRFANLNEVVLHYRRGTQNISHGTDKAATHRVILRTVLPLLGIDASEADIGSHLMALTYFEQPPDAAALRRLHDWLGRLRALNRQRGIFPRESFERRTAEVWDRLFHYLPAFGARVALQHLRLSGRWPKDRLLYLLKYRANALLGRVPSQ